MIIIVSSTSLSSLDQRKPHSCTATKSLRPDPFTGRLSWRIQQCSDAPISTQLLRVCQGALKCHYVLPRTTSTLLRLKISHAFAEAPTYSPHSSVGCQLAPARGVWFSQMYNVQPVYEQSLTRNPFSCRDDDRRTIVHLTGTTGDGIVLAVMSFAMAPDQGPDRSIHSDLHGTPLSSCVSMVSELPSKWKGSAECICLE